MKKSAFYIFSFMHKAMLIGQLLFIAVLFYLVYSKMLVPPLAAQEKIMQVVALVFTAGAMYAGFQFFKKKLAEIKESPLADAKEKFAKYRQACMFQWTLTETPVFICGICYFMTGNMSFLALAALPFLYFVTLAPVKEKTAVQLDISSSELDEL